MTRTDLQDLATQGPPDAFTRVALDLGLLRYDVHHKNLVKSAISAQPMMHRVILRTTALTPHPAPRSRLSLGSLER
jgi:hypothetical protein